jgi:integrase
VIRQLALLPADERTRAGRDRLELLAALISAPGFDPLYRSDVIRLPPDHQAYQWGCEVPGCDCVARERGLCRTHELELGEARKAKISRADFIAHATPLGKHRGFGTSSCRICPERPAPAKGWQLCTRHSGRWRRYRAAVPGADFEQWVTTLEPFPGYGTCKVTACCYLAENPAGMCPYHRIRYRDEGKPGKVRLPGRWMELFEAKGLPVPVLIDDERAFRQWCLAAGPIYADGVVNLMGLQPLVKAEIQWGMHAHAQDQRPAFWDYTALQRLANLCRAGKVTSLFDLAEDWPRRSALPDSELSGRGHFRVRRVVSGILESLWCAYYSPDDAREAGFIETDHFGRRFSYCRSHYDLTAVSQRWLRDLLWDYLADMLRSAKCPRTRGPLDHCRRATIEFSAFLEADAPEGGHDPSLLREEHAQRFVADQRHRERHRLPFRGLTRSDGKPSMVTESSRRVVFNSLHAIAYRALESGAAEAIGLSRAFITALPAGGPGTTTRSRSPFTDEAARALADEGNLRRLAEAHDPHDAGYRDVWEAIVCTGRRASEVIELHLDCIGRYHGLPMLWHDQTKVGNYDEAVRIPEYLYHRLDERRARTLARFEDRHGRPPATTERAAMALFPSSIRNPRYDRPISYGRYCDVFRAWADSLDLGSAVSHQARHTMATNLLRAGATLAHVRRFLGHVSDRMAERYIKVAHSDLEDALNAVWVAGPGSASPGRLLSGGLAPMTREQAFALSLDLSRRSTPTEGGFCTHQPVVNGSACPWNLDCENCDKFVMSGADLLYWRRKQEQWRAIAERAPDNATADYLHKVFEPTARAIDGLEKALAGLGLLDQALTLDLRRPQDYFHRIWSTAFRAADLAEAGESEAVPAGPAGEPA